MRIDKKQIASLMIMLISSSIAFAGIYGRTLCKQAGYHCLKVKRNAASWEALFPDEHDREIARRVNRMNTELYPGLTIAVPDHLETLDILDFAPFPKQITPPGEKLLIFDPALQAFAAYEADGSLIRWGPASGGSDWCKDIDSVCHTHAGHFRIFSLGSSDCISHKFPLPFGGAPMPYCMYFNNGQAFHGEPNGLPGYNASHGCVRLYVDDAEWLRYDFVESSGEDNHNRGTKVIVRPYNNGVEDSDTDDRDHEQDANVDSSDDVDTKEIKASAKHVKQKKAAMTESQINDDGQIPYASDQQDNGNEAEYIENPNDHDNLKAYMETHADL